MNFSALINLVMLLAKNLPQALVVIKEITDMFKATSPLPQTSPPQVITAVAPSRTLMGIQTALNVFVAPTPLLDVDGLYGPKTEAALMQALVKLGIKL